MTGNKPDEMLRTPMQWTSEPGTGFTIGKPWEPANQDYMQVNVTSQDANPDSLLNHYRELVHLRNQNPVLRIGEYLPFSSNCLQLYPVLRVDTDQAFILLANLGRKELEGCAISIEESPLSGQYKVNVLHGEGIFSNFNFAEDGSLVEYSLPNVIQPFQEFILQLNEQ